MPRLEFQLALGRRNELNMASVHLNDSLRSKVTAEQSSLSRILTKLDAATTTTDPAVRLSLTNEAIALVADVRPQFGSGVCVHARYRHADVLSEAWRNAAASTKDNDLT